MTKNKDILLVARPDHSIQIYRALQKHSELKSYYLTFKVVKNFVKKIIPYKKLQTVSKDSSIAIIPTFIQVCKKTFCFKFARNWRTEDFLSPYVRRNLKHTSYKVIHYWPEYAYSVMNEYISINKETKILADMYMPNPAAILADMEPIYRKYNLPSLQNSWLAQYGEQIKEHFKYVTDIVVASSYVRDTMMMTFPDKKYHIIPYGIPVSPTYSKKSTPDVINKFIYVGRVSVEKGCDLMLEWFVDNPDNEIHLYGGLLANQKEIFEPYWKFDNIHYHGAVSRDVLRKETPKFDAGILLSRFDAYAMAIGEIIGCGVPVIVSENTGIKDDVRTNGFGIVTELNMDSYCKAMNKMKNISVHRDFCTNIDTYITSNPVSFGEQVVNLYKSLID